MKHKTFIQKNKDLLLSEHGTQTWLQVLLQYSMGPQGKVQKARTLILTHGTRFFLNYYLSKYEVKSWIHSQLYHKIKPA